MNRGDLNTEYDEKHSRSDKPIESHSIARWLTLSLILTVIVISTIVLTLFYVNASARARADLEERADESIAYLTNILEKSIWEYDHDAVKMISDTFAQEPSVVQLRVKEGNKIIYSLEKENQKHILIIRSGEIFHLNKWKIPHQNKFIGDVQLALSITRYRETMQQLLFSSILTTILILLAIIIITNILIRAFLRKPFKQLTEVVNAYAAGRYDTPIVTIPYREFQPFVKVIGQMGTQIMRQLGALQKAHDELEGRVLKRTRQLQAQTIELTEAKEAALEAKRTAEAANRAKSEFLANMSHGLRTPMNAILGYAQILRQSDDLTKKQQEGLETIKNSGDHLLTLINELLDLSKIEAGHLELQMREFHLPSFLDGVAKLMQVRVARKDVTFEYTPAPDLPAGVRTDAKRLREVLLNLLSNAVKFTKNGSVTFKVRNTRFSDLKGAEALTTNVRFEVEDTGIGIEPEELEEIFEPFRQVGKERFSEGTGLGLAISRRLVKMMGGQLHVNSTSGQGSRFWFELELPVVKGVSPRAELLSRKINGYAGARQTALVADDEQANRTVLTSMLTLVGLNVIEAESGQEAVEKAIEQLPDIMFLDLKMPVLDGFGATQKIREVEEQKAIPSPRPPVPIIAVSASVFPETRQRAQEFGFNDFLIKPFQQEELMELIHTHLPIEWIYEEMAEDETPQPLSENPVGLVFPPPAKLSTLLQFARIGFAKELLAELSALEQQSEKFSPFVKVMHRLIEEYQFPKIIELLEAQEPKR